ncbi:GNAT family N-acetyltransferase [Hwangdonia lutea]|uniref:GNAT family N-acetyltransferase n=1 Tax=Hwangdonia lutea TaxID=3075823 RepID=A0AA97EL07_9FLAO|nr:GNAT family N-acetyltransferase [Hwangdonia sp. SCSIO 19198]WOD43376.1 GNAT family N-acetyltransferase [Hwangdonia sp. SCSIO 19198]
MIKKILNVGHHSFNFFENRKLPDFYTAILYNDGVKDLIFKEFESAKVLSENKLHRVYNIPPYLDLLLDNTNTYRKITLPEIDKGLLVDISKFTTIEDYTAKQFNSRKRKQMRSALKRVETCFNIEYKFYFGEINKEHYDFLLKTARTFIKRRFEQINKNHFILAQWDLINDNLYSLILEKKASVFVIYDNDKPINICFSYHFNKITKNKFASYDIDYAKFSLGSIDLYKQLEWNINKGFKIFDLAMGASKYKFKWCNSHYDLKHDLIVEKKSVVSNLLGVLMYGYLKIKFHVFRYYYKHPNNKLLFFLNRFIPSPTNDSKSNEVNPIKIESKIIKVLDFKTLNLKKIDIETKTYAFLRKPFYDFLHANPELKNNVLIYKLHNEDNSYIIKGKNKIQKLIIIK